jgi:hypothetical protein
MPYFSTSVGVCVCTDFEVSGYFMDVSDGILRMYGTERFAKQWKGVVI